MAECSNPDCGFPDTPCALRTEPGAVCPSLGRDPHASTTPAPAAPARPVAEERFWEGGVIPLDQAGPLLLARRPRLVMVVGLPASGKTTLLTRQYLALASSARGGLPWRLCHSRTLRGYEALAGTHARTVQSALLHLAFKPTLAPPAPDVEDRVVDVALADLNGESCALWARNADRTEGLPLARADHFWVVVDLPSAHRDRRVRSEVGSLLDRVVDTAAGRPIALVLTGSTGAEEPPARVLAPLERHPGEHEIFRMQDDEPLHAALAPLRWSLERPDAVTPDAVTPRGGTYYERLRESPPRVA